MSFDVHVGGLQELNRALNKVNREAGRELRKEMRSTVGVEFTKDAKARAPVRTGRLRDSIKPSMRGADLFVRSSPPLNPGPKSQMGYSAVYEYGYGKRRAFLEPTREDWDSSGKLEREMDGFLDWVEAAFK